MTGLTRNQIICPPQGHKCSNHLPHERGGYGSTGYPDGTLAKCSACGRWWISRPCFESLGPVSRWRPVRWWHQGARRRIESAQKGHKPPNFVVNLTGASERILSQVEIERMAQP